MMKRIFFAIFIFFIAGKTFAQTAPKTTDEKIITNIQALERYRLNDHPYNHHAMTQSYIALPDNLKILVKYLADKNYTAINQVIDEAVILHKKELSDYQLERNVDTAIIVLTDDKYITQSIADEWVKKTPDHYFAHFIKASVYMDDGFSARGEKFSNETSEESFERMKALFDIAYASINKSIELNPDFEFTYVPLIRFMKASSGTEKNAEEAYKKALSVNPYSFTVRWAYMDYNLPQWHGNGSTKNMQNIIDVMGNKKNKSKGLESLKGRVLAFQARQMKDRWTKTLSNGDFAKSIELFDAALSYGDQYIYHYDKAMALFSFHSHEEAFIHIEKAIAIAPYHEEGHYKHAWIKDSLPIQKQKIFPYR